MASEDYSYEDQIRGNTVQEFLNYKKENNNFQRWLLDDLDEISYLQNAIRGMMFYKETNDLI